MFSTLPIFFYFLDTFTLSSANALDLDRSKIVSSGRELKHLSITQEKRGLMHMQQLSTQVSRTSLRSLTRVIPSLFVNFLHIKLFFPNKPWILHVCSTSLLKTLRGKEKLLVTSNFSFSHSVFYQFGKPFAMLSS